MVIYRVRASRAVTGPNSQGKRRRTCTLNGVDRILEFGATPTYIDYLPEEVRLDPHLMVDEVTIEQMNLLNGKLLRIAENAAGEPPPSDTPPPTTPPPGDPPPSDTPPPTTPPPGDPTPSDPPPPVEDPPPPGVALSDLTVEHLRARCTERGLAVRGTKAELIARLQGANA